MITQRKPTHPGSGVTRGCLASPWTHGERGGETSSSASTNIIIIVARKKFIKSYDGGVRIAKATKTSPESWLYMQAKLDLWNAAQGITDIEEFAAVKAY